MFKILKEAIKNFALVFKSVREYKVYAIITPLFMIVEAGIECVIPFLMSQLLGYIANPLDKDLIIVDKILNITPSPDINWGVIWFFIIAMVGGALLSLLSGILGGVFAARASTGMAKNLRYDLYKKVQSFSFANIDKFHASSLVTRMTTDINTVTMAFQMLIRMVVRAPLMMIFSIVMAFVVGGPMAWIFIGLTPLILLGFVILMLRAMPTFRRIFKKYDKLNESVEENVAGIRVVKTYVREDYENAKFKKASDDIEKEFIHAEKIVAWANPLLNLAIHVSNVLICALGSLMIVNTVGKDLDVSKLSALQTSIIAGRVYGVTLGE